MLRCNRTAALAPGFRGQTAILGEAALLVRHIGTALAGNLALFLVIHAGKAAECFGAWALVLLSHASTSCVVPSLIHDCGSTTWARFGFPSLGGRDRAGVA